MWIKLWTTVLIVLGTARATRFVTEDTLGHWLLVQPARRWAMYGTKLYHAPAYVIDEEWRETDPTTKRQKLVSGLDCPFCVGFWIGVAVLLTHRIPGARFILTALSLNYVVGHLSSRIDG